MLHRMLQRMLEGEGRGGEEEVKEEEEEEEEAC